MDKWINLVVNLINIRQVLTCKYDDAWWWILKHNGIYDKSSTIISNNNGDWFISKRSTLIQNTEKEKHSKNISLI